MSINIRQTLRNNAAVVLRNVPFPGRDKVFRMVERTSGKNPGTFVVPLRGGGKLIVDGVKDSPIFYKGEYDWHIRSFLARNIKSGQTVFDLGANIGAYTIPMALRAGASGHVYAFEALKANYEILLENIRLNRLSNVTAVYGAITDITGICEAPKITERSQFMGNYSLASNSSSRSQIPSWSLDDFVEENAIPKVHLMKIDIEGSETMALKGARKLFSQGRVDTVVCEFNPYWLPKMGSNVEELYDSFSEFGMDAFLLTRFSRLKPIDRDFCERATTDFDAVLKRPAESNTEAKWGAGR
jgi:FkbM family methyltransferase